MELTITEKISKTITLNMIVKNEAHIIEKTLQNICEYIPIDYWVICDTGSTDGTQDSIKKFFNAKNIKGELHQCEWKNFGHNRTEALEKAFNKTDYLLIFDADDSIQGDFHLPTLWKYDSYCLKFGNIDAGETVYKRVLLINNRKKYVFRGVLHEFIVGISDNITETTIEGDYYLISGREGARSQNPNKYIDDARMLEKGFHEETEDQSLKHRYAFYCAQSYKDAGRVDTSIHWFEKALTFPIWNQEKYYSCYQLGYLYEQKGEVEKAIHYWLKTSQYDPERIEGIVAACNKYRDMNLNEIAVALYSHYANYAEWTTNLHEKLFVEVHRYQQELEWHCSIAAGYTRQKKYGYECCKIILLRQQQPLHILKCTINNLQYYTEFIEKDPDHLELFYAIDHILSKIHCDAAIYTIWSLLFKQNRKKLTQAPNLMKQPENKEKPFIFISFTTCKRWDLFQQTMNSILNHWQDYNKIDYWFCVDDNSSQKDRDAMQTTYPWMDYYMKTLQEKGHRNSMNIIWDKLNELKPTYWIHMEDDFLFHKKYKYIDKSIECLHKYKEENIKQVLFNRGYGETIEDYSITSYTPLNNEFSLHDHKQGHFSTRNCHYWPHYSFRPSLIEVNTILQLGNYDSHNQFFEMDYANRWNNAGYKSAFINYITNQHIGRLTSDRSNKDLPNAYELNNEEQFIQKSSFMNIINLERRSDRKKSTEEELKKADCNDYTFIKAIDGKTLNRTPEIRKLFEKNDFGNRIGVIGCALSHYYLWKALIEDNDNDFYLIMEDDFILCEGFKENLEMLKKDMKTKEVLFLGYHMFEKEREKVKEIYDCSSNNVKITKLNHPIFIGGMFGYSINTKGARQLIEYIEKNGIQHGIDYVLGKLNSNICYETQPHLCFSVWNENEKEIDSDIQYDYTSLDLTEPYVQIVNLERRKDRKQKMIEKMKKNGILHYNFFTAFDGMTMESTPELKLLFQGNDFNNTRGVIGCAMSHYTLWKQLLKDKENESYLILEDDINFADGFKENFPKIAAFEEKDIIFLGYTIFKKDRNNLAISTSTLQLEKLNKKKYIGGFFSYFINKNGAQKLVDYINKNGIKHGIDYLIKINTDLECYEIQPPLICSQWAGDDTNTDFDSDVQNLYASMIFSKNDFVFVQGLDQISNDLYYQKLSIEKCMQRADKDENCVAFNTLGFFKDKIEHLTSSPYFAEKDGIYIKKEYYEAYQNNDIPKYFSQWSQDKILNTEVFKNKKGGIFVDIGANNGIKGSNSLFFEQYLDWTGLAIEANPDIFELLDKNRSCIKLQCAVYSKNGSIEFIKNTGYTEVLSGIKKCYNKKHFERKDKEQKLYGGNSTIIKVNAYTLNHLMNKNNIKTIDYLSIDVEGAEKDIIKSIDFIKIHINVIDFEVNYYNNDYKEIKDILIKNNFQFYKKIGGDEVFINNNLNFSWDNYDEKLLNRKTDNSKIKTKKTKIKMLCNWCSSEQLCQEWSTMCEEGLHWQDIEMTSEDENIDYYIIINKPQKGATYNPKKTLVFQMEPWIYNATKNWGVHTWGEWSVPDEKKFLYVGRHKNYLNNIQWQITIPPMIPDVPMRLNKALTFLSAKNFDWGHKKRIEFLKKLEDRNKSQLKEPMNIAFWDNSLCERGTTTSVFDYAFYNEKILGNKSYIFYDKNESGTKKKIIEKFEKHFIVQETDDFKEVDDYLLKYKITHIYIQKWGKLDTRISKVAKNCIHCVFDCYHPHGDIYASISPWVEGNNGKFPVIPYMINLPKHNRNMRQKLNIPLDAIVFGGYGGSRQFDIQFVQKVVYNMAKKYSHIYFLFANFNKFCADLPNIIHLPMITDLEEKVEVINTCDAMLWGRSDGETYGLAIAEFSTLNKPIIAMKIGYQAHVHLLGNKAMWYSNENNLTEILLNFNPEIERKKDWNAYKDYTPEKVMDIFQKEFLSESLIDIYGRENYHSLAHYKGALKDDKKENHYIDYKYCFAVENNSERNYATEKIWEPILCECLTFYWGCPGLEKHINEKAFVRLDITDFEGSLATIQQAIKEDWWSQRISIIRQEKQRIIKELGFFPQLKKIIKDGEKK